MSGAGSRRESVVGTRAHCRVLGIVATAAVVMLSACGGGGGSKSSATTTPAANGGNASTTTSAGGGGSKGSCFTNPGPQTARVRFVNLYTNAAYPTGSIDVWQGFSAQDPCGKKLATVPYGTATDYIDVTASDKSGNWSAISYPAGSTTEDHQIISQSETWKGGEQVTMVVQAQDPTSGNSPAAGADQTFYEKPISPDINSTLVPVPGKAVVAIAAGALQYVEKDGAWRAGIVGTSKCLLATGDTADVTTNIGGTSLVPYTVDPGSINLGLYKSIPGTCAGTPDIRPTTIDAAAGSRTLVFAYGASPSSTKLLVVPVAG